MNENTTDTMDATISMDQNEALEENENKQWQIIYMSIVLFLAFGSLISDKIGADMVMISALTLSMAANIISIEEGLAGFANEGLLTVIALFVVAAGINHTGALDWYMGRLLGRPKSIATAQIRLMIPIAIVSAFLNNTPVVVVMIPIVQRWGENIGVNPKQLLIPLSFASILGGTCTLIGTSTNLVVFGLLEERYPDSEPMGLFDIGLYGIPIALAGTAYILLMSPILLPGASTNSDEVQIGGSANVLLGARLTPWSPACGRTVKRSGLRDTGGIYLVSVYRSETGRVHRAVGQDFGLNVGDILYFASGFPETFAEFCNEQGLEVVTNEIEDNIKDALYPSEHDEKKIEDIDRDLEKGPMTSAENHESAIPFSVSFSVTDNSLEPIAENDEAVLKVDFESIGTTKESLALSDYSMKMRSVNKLTDMIRGNHDEKKLNMIRPKRSRQASILDNFGDTDPSKIIVVNDKQQNGKPLIIIGVNTRDRPGLLHDISKGVIRLNLQCRSTEAAVVDSRSISIWRCEFIGDGKLDIDEVWSILNALLESTTGIQAVKQRGLVVIRSVVQKNSRLISRTAIESQFSSTYKAAIVAIRRGEKTPEGPMSCMKLEAGDILILQTQEDSPLLVKPDPRFYQNDNLDSSPKKKSFTSIARRLKNSFGSSSDLELQDRLTRNDSNNSLNKKSPRISSRNNSFDATGVHPSASKSNYDVENENRGPNTDFFIGTADDSDNEIEVVSNPSNSVSDEVNEKEEISESQLAVWRDLRVFFVNNDEFGESTNAPDKREFLTAMQIKRRSQLVNRTAIQSGLDKLSGVFLVSIERLIEIEDNETLEGTDSLSISSPKSIVSVKSDEMKDKIVSVAPDDILIPGDILWFSGPANKIGDLRKIPGLSLYENDEVKKVNAEIQDRRLVQAVVARKGPLVGKTVVDVKFRTRYGAAVIAVHREGKRVYEHPGKVKLQAGDVLLLEAGPTFVVRNADTDRSFALLSEVENSAPPRLRLLLPALFITVAMLAIFTAGVSSLLICALIASMLMVVLGILSQQEVRDAINWDVYLTIASAFGLGTALTNSGISGNLAIFLVNLGEAVGIGFAGLYGAVYFATFLLSNIVTNNAAAALVFPIAMDVVDQAGADKVIMSYTLMLGASASFMSPFGYTTNLLIFGPGGYKTKDFLKIGTPMQIVLWIISVLFLSFDKSFPWYWSWVITLCCLLLVILFRGFGSNLSLSKIKKQ